MNHEDYVRKLSERDPHFDADRAVARAILEFSDVVAEHARQRNVSPESVARETGIDPDRVEALIDGETPNLDELLHLCAALHIELTIGDQFGVITRTMYQSARPSKLVYDAKRGGVIAREQEPVTLPTRTRWSMQRDRESTSVAESG